MTVTLGRIAAGDFGQDLISNFNNNATALENALSALDTLVGSKVGSNDVVALRENNNALEYSLNGSDWKTADTTIWGNITGNLTDQVDLRDALGTKAAKSTVDNQQVQINNLNSDLGTVSGNVNTLANTVQTLGTTVQTFGTQIADMVTSGNIAYLRQVTEGDIKYLEWSADNINWYRTQVEGNAVWGSITGTLSQQTDLNNELTGLRTDIDTVSGNLADTNSTVSNLGTTLGTVETQVNTNTGDISNLQTNKASTTSLTAHTGNTSNPHSVTKAQVGLGNVDNTADDSKPLSSVQRATLNEIFEEEGFVRDAKNISDLWLGTESDYLMERDLNKDILYFVSDIIDYDYKYFVGYILTETTELEDLDIKYSVSTSGGASNVNLIFTNTGASPITVRLNSGSVVTDQGAYNYVVDQFTINAASTNTLALPSSFADTEEIEYVNIDIKWK